MLPPKRKKSRSGIARGSQRRFPKHEKWVRGHGCIVAGCENTNIEVMHLRSAANSGIGIKPPSWFTVSGCGAHHNQAHSLGHDTFAAMHGIDLWALAAEFARLSPDREMKEAMRNKDEDDDGS